MATIKLNINDEVKALMDCVTDKWLLQIVESNPGILTVYRDKNLKPTRNLLPWSGEFAGKYLTGAAEIYNITKNEAIRTYCEAFIDKLLSYQESNGYLGVFEEKYQLTGNAIFYNDYFTDRKEVKCGTWDLWNHYHIMIGLLLWWQILDKHKILESVEKIGSLMMNTFYDADGRRMVDIGWSEMNLVPYHAFALLYNLTGKKAYLDFAKKIEEDTEDERAGNYMKYAVPGKEYYQCPKPRWESLHIIMGYAEMYKATGEEKYLRTLHHIVHSILHTDVHNTGAFSTNEQAVGSPYRPGSIETCCVIAYNALMAELLRLEPDITLADALERSLYNAIIGSFSTGGYWSTYDTPMDGYRKANFDSINFQNRPGMPMMNCCSANAPHGLGTLINWAAFDKDGEGYIHYFGRGDYATKSMAYHIDGNYPYDNVVTIYFTKESVVNIRIPAWADELTVQMNNKDIPFQKGTYLQLNVANGDMLKLTFGFALKFEYGQETCEGKVSVSRGPILLGLDNALNPKVDFDNPMLHLSKTNISSTKISMKNGLLSVQIGDIVLNDFYHLGQDGSAYRTWLPANFEE